MKEAIYYPPKPDRAWIARAPSTEGTSMVLTSGQVKRRVRFVVQNYLNLPARSIWIRSLL